jgi:hypothetical protein
MEPVSSPSSEAKKRPNGIIIIAALWVLTSIFVINWGLGTIIFDFGYDPYAPELLELSAQAREWLRIGVPADIVLSLSIVALSFLTVFTAYGLFTAKSWSYKSAIAILASTAIIDGATATLYASAPVELGFALEYSLYLVLTLINLVWLAVMLVYLRKPNVKQYIIGSAFGPIASNVPASPTPPAPVSLPHWGTREGDIIKAIVSCGRPLTWNEIHQATGLDEELLNKALSNLFSSKELQKIRDARETRYRVSHKLYTDYYNHLRTNVRTERRTELIRWINQWKEVRKLDFSLEHEHFFLEGRHLDDFSKELISHAESEVLVVNPFVQDCDLSNTLRDIKRHGIKVKIITRSPRDKHPEYLKNKQEYLSRLEKEGISLVYSEKVHAKIIVVDNSVAIVSSMNFYPDSSAGVSWEAGLITIDEKVVDSIANSPLSRLA